MAVNEGHLLRNPAELLFVPREARHPEYTVMTCSDVRTCLSILAKREQIIFRFAVFGGLRPGEIFGLKWMHIGDAHALISQRVYRGHVDTPKTIRSIRKAAIPAGLLADLRQWKAVSRNSGDDDWVFPSRNKGKPLSRDNVFRRHIAPMLKSAGLGWVNFHVMRRTHATLMNEIVDDPKLVADQLGHTLDVNLNIYTRASLARLKNAVDALEGALCSAKPIEAE
jgi:integrase